MHYITEMHVMPITFQLLLHYNKFLHVGYFTGLLKTVSLIYFIVLEINILIKFR